ncbi:MAG: type II toxin-antitoxin system VapC family toxin [Acidobacteriota bacterium]
MILPDVNVLVYAFRTDSDSHAAMKRWLEGAISAEEPYGLSDLVLSGFLRVVTHPKVFFEPSPLAGALAFTLALRGRPNAVTVAPGPRHWEIFEGLCRSTRVRGNLVPDAYLAALAIESGCEWVTTDRDYARFPNLRWRHPLESPPPRPPRRGASLR